MGVRDLRFPAYPQNRRSHRENPHAPEPPYRPEPAPAAKPYKLSDGGGLFLLVKPTGAKAWRWKFRLAGKEGLFAVGSYPEKSLAEARKSRDAARELVAKGINPAHQRQAERRQNIAVAEARRREAEGTFAKVATAWLEQGQQLWAPATHAQKASRVKRYLLPSFAGLPITRIGAPELRRVLEACGKAGAWSAVNVKATFPRSSTTRSSVDWWTQTRCPVFARWCVFPNRRAKPPLRCPNYANFLPNCAATAAIPKRSCAFA